MDTISYRCFIDGSANREDYIEDMENLVYYTLSRGVDPKQKYKVVCGEHRMGESERPHFHLHIQTPLYRKSANEARDRNAYLKDSPLHVSGQELTAKFQHCVTDQVALNDHLSYPLKEGLYVKLNVKHKQVQFLEGTELESFMVRAELIFEGQKKIIKRKSNLAKKSLTLLQQCVKISETIGKIEYSEWKQRMYTIFHEDLEVAKYPCYNDLRNAVHKVAIFHKIVSASYYDKT